MNGGSASIEWIRSFETVCARYSCRPVEDIDVDGDANLWMSGPGGSWLTEISSVEFDENGALTRPSRTAVHALGRNAIFRDEWRAIESSRPPPVTNDRRRRRRRGIVSLEETDVNLYYRDDEGKDNDDDDDDGRRCDIEIDWFLHDAAASHTRFDQRRQCLIRVCLNYRVVRLTLLANTTRCGTVSPRGLAFARYPNRLRPFVVILLCELIARGIAFEVLNLHYEPLRSSETWLLSRGESSTGGHHDNGAEDRCRGRRFTSGWLEMIRDAHSRGRWIRLLPSTKHETRIDGIVTQRATNGGGRIRYAWRDDAFVSSNGIGERHSRRYGVCSLVANTLLSLRDLEIELLENCRRSCTLNLCDFATFDRNTKLSLLFDRDWTVGCDDDDDDATPVAVVTEDSRERRHFIDATGTLSSALYARFS